MVDYVYAKYWKNWKQSDEVSDEMLDDLYNHAMLKGYCICCIVLYMVKGKYLSMVESSKATNKDYRKLLVIDEIHGVIKVKEAKHDQLKVNKDPKKSKASTRQVAFNSTFNAQAASTSAPIGYRKTGMTGCVLAIRAFNDQNDSTSAPRKRKFKKP
nr:hypothetical protein CTI12_AA415750 [Tanacetum cinerariifolium]